jgi:hypothetical protein
VKNTKYYILVKKGLDHKETPPHNNDIYLAYIDFGDVFGFTDHTRLLSLMEDLG